MSILSGQTPILRDGFGDLVHVDIADVPKSLDVVDVTRNDLREVHQYQPDFPSLATSSPLYITMLGLGNGFPRS
jgi:hypothetical protein